MAAVSGAYSWAVRLQATAAMALELLRMTPGDDAPSGCQMVFSASGFRPWPYIDAHWSISLKSSRLTIDTPHQGLLADSVAGWD